MHIAIYLEIKDNKYLINYENEEKTYMKLEINNLNYLLDLV